jgi:superfamily I DNA/RNA helicase
MDMPLDKLQEKGEAVLAEAIQRMRDRKVIIKEGYDGEYGVIKVFKDKETLDPKSQQGLFSSQKQGPPIPKRKLINFDLKEYRRLYSRQATTAEPIQMSLESKKHTSEEDSSLSDLNPEQQKAASHFAGPALITAGPGTGKTRTLTLRITYLIKEKGVPAENILAVTFTNKAADEIKQRLALILKSNKSESRPQVSTFHAFGYSVLKTHSIRLDRKKHFTILDKNDKQQVLRKISGCSQKKAVSVVAAISEAKQDLKLPGEVKDQEIRMIFQLYEDYLKKGNAFDLDDCIYHPVLLFNRNPDILAAYRKQFPWILIDEYQDINFAQYRMVRQLMPGKNSNICVIGDPDQAIYGFRGADVRFIREFTHDYPEAVTFKLKQSYRCSDIIIKASSQVISGSLKNPEFLKGLQEGVKITISPQATDKSEAEFTARSIEEKMGGLRFFSIDSDISSGQEHGEIKSLSDFAVLCRIKGQMKAIEKAFHDHSIPYQIIGDTPFFRVEPIKSVIDVLKLSANPQNRFLKDKLAEKRALDMPTFSFLYNKETERPVAAVISGIISRIFKKEEAGHKATLHAAKGLEFKCVFIVGCEDGLLPYSLFGRESNRDEEQRLLYVGMTRAKKLLTLSHSRNRFLMGREYKLPRSPFLDNIETELTELAESKGAPKKKESQMKLF